MPSPTRRKVVTTLAGIFTAGVSGCLGSIKQNTPIGPNLKEKWKKNDDFPQDDFRNLAFGPSGSIASDTEYGSSRKRYFPGVNRGELTFGYTTENAYLFSAERVNHTVISSEIKFEATAPVDVYVRPKPEDGDFFTTNEDDDLSDVDYIKEYSEFGVKNYHKVLESNKEEVFEFIITKGGYTPRGALTTQEKVDMSADDPIEIDGWSIRAVYVPFEHYKNADEESSTRRLYNHKHDSSEDA